jgi:hypothetical protein
MFTYVEEGLRDHQPIKVVYWNDPAAQAFGYDVGDVKYRLEDGVISYVNASFSAVAQRNLDPGLYGRAVAFLDQVDKTTFPASLRLADYSTSCSKLDTKSVIVFSHSAKGRSDKLYTQPSAPFRLLKEITVDPTTGSNSTLRYTYAKPTMDHVEFPKESITIYFDRGTASDPARLTIQEPTHWTIPSDLSVRLVNSTSKSPLSAGVPVTRGIDDGVNVFQFHDADLNGLLNPGDWFDVKNSSNTSFRVLDDWAGLDADWTEVS